MTADARSLVARLAETLAARFTTAGHPYAFVQNEHLGTCSVYGCGPTCEALTALLREAVEYLEVTQEAASQPGLFEEEAG